MSTRTQVEPDAGSEQPLHVKCRPASLKALWGQDHITRSLKGVLEAPNRPHSYLFVGPSGCGKTTLARIVAAAVGASVHNIIEADAATNTGIEAMRAITDTLHYKGFGGQSTKMVIIDEAHALSKAAWQSLLKVVEEPPPHVYFAFCTTELAKVPETIQTRCARYTVKELSTDDMFDYLVDVCKQEDIDASEALLDIVVKRAEGSPRKALTALSIVMNARDLKEAAILLQQPMESEEVITLLRDLVSNRLKWPAVVSVLNVLRGSGPVSLGLTVVDYLNAVLLKSTPSNAPYLLDVLSRFMTPCNRSEKMAPILLAFGDLVLPPSRK